MLATDRTAGGSEEVSEAEAELDEIGSDTDRSAPRSSRHAGSASPVVSTCKDHFGHDAPCTAATRSWCRGWGSNPDRQGLDLYGAAFRASTGFPWAAGVFAGWIEPDFTLDANAGYRINNNLKVFLTGNNILNEQWFSVYGGSVNGRRIMAGATATF